MTLKRPSLPPTSSRRPRIVSISKSTTALFVGDSEWDLLAAVRKSSLGVGFLSGGYAQAELERAGAFRVYSDAADMLMHIEQLGLPGR
jgi:phosphoglycolate phosphatase-like HAD superfamily hydrolase